MLKKCIHCGNRLVEWKESNSYALVKLDTETKALVKNTLFPVTVRFCENCKYVDLELLELD